MTGIYYGNHTTLQDRFAIHIEPQSKREKGVFVEAHEEIGDIFNEIARCLRQEESIPKKLFKQLGVHPSDTDAHESMQGICSFIINTDHVIIPTLDPGVFYIVEASKEVKAINVDDQKHVSDFLDKVRNGEIIPKALFKVGRKRAQLELAARRIASMVNLKDHIIFGMFSSMRVEKLPKFWANAGLGAMTEDLWNGDMKTFHHSTENGHIVGILEPYLVEKDPSGLSTNDKLNQFARLTLLGVVLGLRDAHKRNIVDGVFVDAEEIFPERLDPDPKVTTATAAHHLTYLFEEDLCQQALDPVMVRGLYDLISGVDVITLASQLQKQKKKFADFYHDDTEEALEDVSEGLELEEEEGELDRSNSSSLFEPIENNNAAKEEDCEVEIYRDEGGCEVEISEYERELNPLFTPNTTPYMFTEKACSTFIDRFLKLRTVLEEEIRRPQGLSCLDIVKKVDPFFDYQARLHRLASLASNKPPVRKAASDTKLLERHKGRPRPTSASSIDFRLMTDPSSVGRMPSPYPPSPGGKISFESLFAEVARLEREASADLFRNSGTEAS